MLPSVFIVTDHRRRQKVVRKATANSAAPRVPLFLSLPRFEVKFWGLILILIRRTATKTLYVKQTHNDIIFCFRLIPPLQFNLIFFVFVVFIIFIFTVNNPYNSQVYLCVAVQKSVFLYQWYEPWGRFMKVQVIIR